MNQTASSQAHSGPLQQYVTFTLGDGEYGIEILNVQEFKGYGAVTPVPNMPPYLRGVMNLRGVIIPVFDLRVRFGLEATLNAFTVIVVAVVQGRTIGLVVDAVSDVIDIAPGEIQATPEFSTRVATACFRGMANTKGKLVVLLNLEQLTAVDEIAAAVAS